MNVARISTGYTIEPASCGEGFHIKYSGHVLRRDRKPLLFKTVGQAEEHIQELCKPAVTSVEYQQAALRTLYPDLSYNQRLGLCGLGLPGEIGEVVDLLKKFLYHRNGKELPVDKVKDELGDVLWYLAVLLDTVGLTFEQVRANTLLELRPVIASDLACSQQLELSGLKLVAAIGRVVDLLHQFLYCACSLDINQLKDGLADVFLYLYLLLDTLGLTLEDVMQANVTKLETRHANGFNPRYTSDSGASV